MDLSQVNYVAFTPTKLPHYDYHVLEDVVRSRCSRSKVTMSAVLVRKGIGGRQELSVVPMDS